MRLSKFSEPIVEFLSDTNMCRLVGEFAGNDVHLQRGDEYYVLESGRYTHINTEVNNQLVGARLGENRHVHAYKVIRRTPCSYICSYKHTIVICHGRWNVWKFSYVFENLMKQRARRFFPNRTLDVQKYLNEYTHLVFENIPNTVTIRYQYGNFHLDLREGMKKFLLCR